MKISNKYFPTAFRCYSTQHHHHISNQEYRLVQTLKSCQSLIHVQNLQSHIIKSGHHSNIFITNTLINLYANFSNTINDAESIWGSSPHSYDPVSCNIMLSAYLKFRRFSHARQLFDKMPEKNTVSFTTVISALAQNGYWYDVVTDVFREMRFLGLLPNHVTLSSVLSSYTHVCSKDKNVGKMLHGLVAKLGFHDCNVVLTNLVNVYCACLCLDDARILFDGMSYKNIVTWNVMLNGYSKAKLPTLARDLFDKMTERDVVSWGTIIGCVLRVDESLKEALMLYQEMLNGGILPNDVLVVEVIAMCGQVSAFCEGQQFHGVSVKLGFDLHDFVQSTIIHFYAACHNIELAQIQFKIGIKNHLPCWNALISGLVRNNMIDSARELFDRMPTRDVFSWSSMISGYSQTEQPHMALELFDDMMSNGIKPNEVTMVSMLSAVANLGILQQGRWAHEYIINQSIPINDNLSAAIIDMYAKCGSIKNALQVFNQVRENAFTNSPWNAIICGLAMHGHAGLSLEIFSNLEKRKIKPNAITLIGVLSACCHVGLVEEGERHFKRMKNLYNIEPNIKHYGCMVDLLSRAGRLEEAEELIKSMPMKADVVIWGTLLSASRTYGNVEMGERAAECLANAEPSHGPGRILLSNLYIDAGRLDDAAFVRQKMRCQRLTRSPGYSGVI
uniref:pentatricopeptide repeat-containing protein At5g19020, mitochondrial n=1 Tax=Erigeron canadensis TaxID=72917 RepID=UPI001CB8E6F9|nr:pentatricopeptide repeat-containing protein At5g19020, mitochondrial [Erigeron canadensis]